MWSNHIFFFYFDNNHGSHSLRKFKAKYQGRRKRWPASGLYPGLKTGSTCPRRHNPLKTTLAPFNIDTFVIICNINLIGCRMVVIWCRFIWRLTIQVPPHSRRGVCNRLGATATCTTSNKCASFVCLSSLHYLKHSNDDFPTALNTSMTTGGPF